MLKRIYEFRDSTEAATVSSLLKDSGYHPSGLQVSPYAGAAGAVITYCIQVPEEEYESAKQCLLTLGYKKVI